jgi:hypothetical protein
MNRTDAERCIADRVAELRTRLEQLRVATRGFSGSRPGDGRAFAVPAGARMQHDDPIVAKYPDSFRPMTESELRWQLKSEETHLRLAAGL